MKSCIGSMNSSLNGAAHTIPNHVSNNVPLLKKVQANLASQFLLQISVAAINQPLCPKMLGTMGQMTKSKYENRTLTLLPYRRQANTCVIHLCSGDKGSGPSIHQELAMYIHFLIGTHTICDDKPSCKAHH